MKIKLSPLILFLILLIILTISVIFRPTSESFLSQEFLDFQVDWITGVNDTFTWEQATNKGKIVPNQGIMRGFYKIPTSYSDGMKINLYDKDGNHYTTTTTGTYNGPKYTIVTNSAPPSPSVTITFAGPVKLPITELPPLSQLSSEFNIYANTTINGDLGNPYYTDIDVSKCQSNCDENAICHGFVYGVDQKSCWLQNKEVLTNSRKTTTSNFIMGVIKPSNVEYKSYGKSNSVGSDLTTSYYIAPTQDSCETSCSENPECYGYVYIKNSDPQQKCYHKSYDVYNARMTSDPSVTEFKVKKTPTTGNTFFDLDINNQQDTAMIAKQKIGTKYSGSLASKLSNQITNQAQNSATIATLGDNLVSANKLLELDDSNKKSVHKTELDDELAKLKEKLVANLAKIASLTGKISEGTGTSDGIRDANGNLIKATDSALAGVASSTIKNIAQQILNDIQSANIAELDNEIQDKISNIYSINFETTDAATQLSNYEQVLYASQVYITELTEQLANLTLKDNTVGSSLLTNLTGLITSQHQSLIDTIGQFDTTILDGTKMYYQDRQIYNLAYINKYLLVIYLIFVCIIGYFLYQKPISIYWRVGYFMLFLTFPFFASKAENWIITIIKYGYSLLTGTIYNRRNN